MAFFVLSKCRRVISHRTQWNGDSGYCAHSAARYRTDRGVMASMSPGTQPDIDACLRRGRRVCAPWSHALLP